MTLTIDMARVVQMPVCFDCQPLDEPKKTFIFSYLIPWALTRFERHARNDPTQPAAHHASSGGDGTLRPTRDIVGLISQDAGDAVLKKPDT